MGAKNACGEGVCGACSVIVDGKLLRSCVVPVEKVEGASVLTIEGIEAAELELYATAFSEAGAVQCGYCTPGMVMATKALLDANPDPDPVAIRNALRGNLCRCTGYAKIVEAVGRAAALRRGAIPASPVRPAGPAGQAGDGMGSNLLRVDAMEKARGRALYVDDFNTEGMLHGGALRTPHPRARLLSLDVSAAKALPGVMAVATAGDIPGSRFTGHLAADWPTLVEVGEESRYIGDAVALVAAETREALAAGLAAIKAEWEALPPLTSAAAALEPGAAKLHAGGNILSRIKLARGDAVAALAASAHVVEEAFETPFTDHAFLEPESALAYPPDAEGVVLVRTGEQNVYMGRKYVADTLGLPPERVRVVSAYVGGAFGGKEDQSVQHHAALLAWLAGRPVKLTLSRAESTRVHVKRHPMQVSLRLGCDAEGRLTGLVARIVADTGAYASLGVPVLQRAVIHAGGPYAYRDVEVEGLAVFTNNPPAGAFRGFGVPQVTFALESALNLLAAKAGISPWELRYRNAVRPGDELPNGQLAGPDTALVECLLALKPDYEGAAGPVGIACGFKNVGLGVGHHDVGRCRLAFRGGGVVVLTGAACIGQGLQTVLTQIAASTLGIAASSVSVPQPDTLTTPDSGTTTASRQTLVTGEACRRACEEALRAWTSAGAPPSAPILEALAGRDFHAEYDARTEPFDSKAANPVRHVAYSYACHLAELGPDARVQRVVAVHDSGLVVNPLAFEGQVEGGVAMGLGYALTEDLPLADCVPPAKFGRLGLLRAGDMPAIETRTVRKAGGGSAADGGVSGAAYGAKGIGEISTIPTAAAVAGAYLAADGQLRRRLPLAGTPYSRG
jgi:xanthine dehydrogenase molybdenum-binding subunit